MSISFSIVVIAASIKMTGNLRGYMRFVKKHRYAYCNLFNKKTKINARELRVESCAFQMRLCRDPCDRLKRNIHYLASLSVPDRRDLRHSGQYQLKVAKEE